MNTLYWIIVSLLFQINFGFGWGIALTIVSVIVIDFLVTLEEVKKELSQKNILESNIVLKIEKVEHNGEVFYMVFTEPGTKFELQGTSSDEVARQLITKYYDKNIFCINDKGKLDLVQIHKAVK